MAVIGGSGQKSVTAILGGKIGYTVDAYNATLLKTLDVSVAANTPTVVLNITGSGVLQFSGMGGSGQANTSNTVVIEIDGVTVLTDTYGASTAGYILCQVGMYQAYSNSTGRNVAYLDHITFNESLKVTATSAGGVSSYHYRYFLT